MSSTRLKDNLKVEIREVPCSPGAALIVGRLRERRQELYEEKGDAIVHAGVALNRLHEAFLGSAAAVSGDRTPRYRRAQLAGEKALPLEDLVYMALESPKSVLLALEVLLSVCGRTSIPLPSDATSVSQANSGVFRAFGEFEALLAEAMEDGVLDRFEAWTLLDQLQTLQERLTEMVGALTKKSGEAP